VIRWIRKLYNRWEVEAFRHALLNDAMRWIAPAPCRPEPHTWSADDVTCSWLGHSTVLINFYGITILTDPVLGRRMGFKLGPFVLGPKRYVQPALRYYELPPIDLVLVSHGHMDHLDYWTLRRMDAASTVVTSRNTSDLLRHTWLTDVRELGWHEITTLFRDRGGLKIHAFPTSHWGARVRSDHHRAWNGYILERNGRRILFGGDTGYTRMFEQLRSHGPFDIAIMPIGAYRPWLVNHCTPEQALQMCDEAGAQYIVPIHHQTFRLSWEPMGEPIARLEKAVSDAPHRLALRRIGETFVLPAAPTQQLTHPFLQSSELSKAAGE